MPIMKAAKKAMRQSAKRYKRNHATKRRIHDAIKELEKLAKAGKKNEAAKKLPEVVAMIDKAAKRNLFHENKAARKKSQLAKLVG